MRTGGGEDGLARRGAQAAVVGVATLEHERAEETIDRLTKKYTGQDKYPAEWRGPGEERVTIRVKPQGIHRYGY